MIFNFQLLGLVILTGLIIIHYLKINELNNIYKGMITTMYITELLYIASYISINQNINEQIFIKFYLISLITSFSLLTLYFIVLGLKNKYQSKETIYENKSKMAKKIFIYLNIITSILIILSKLNININQIYGKSVIITHLFILMYTTINIISYNNYKKNYTQKQKLSLITIIILSIICNIISYKLTRIPALNSCIVLLALLLFYSLDDKTEKEIEILQLERDHARKNNFDNSKFLTDLSHEIRVPLNTIEGFCQVIEEENNIDNIKEDIKDIRKSSQDLIDIINGIIDMTIIESGNLEIINEPYNIEDMIKHIDDIVKSKLKNDKVKFNINISKDIPKVLIGDSDRIEQLLLSIINNSIKFTEKGHINLNIDTINSPNICRLKISIEDTGIGIKEEELNRIFESKNDNNLEKNNLSLRYSKKLLDLMDGKIDVQSKEKKGTTFTITIDQKNTDQKEKQHIKKEVQIFDASNKRVLLVDDNKLNIKVASKLLNPYKIEIIEASSGKECLDILEKDNKFDLILMDDMMPSMSGTETLDILKKIERIDGYTIPVVVLTANAIYGMKEKYLSKGFDDYLAKPIDKYELNKVLIKFLKQKD